MLYFCAFYGEASVYGFNLIIALIGRKQSQRFFHLERKLYDLSAVATNLSGTLLFHNKKHK